MTGGPIITNFASPPFRTAQHSTGDEMTSLLTPKGGETEISPRSVCVLCMAVLSKQKAGWLAGWLVHKALSSGEGARQTHATWGGGGGRLGRGGESGSSRSQLGGGGGSKSVLAAAAAAAPLFFLPPCRGYITTISRYY